MSKTMPRYIKRPATKEEAENSTYFSINHSPGITKFSFLNFPSVHKTWRSKDACAFETDTGNPTLEFLLKATNGQIAFARYHGLKPLNPAMFRYRAGHPAMHKNKLNAFQYLVSIGDIKNLRALFDKISDPLLTKEMRQEMRSDCKQVNKDNNGKVITDHTQTGYQYRNYETDGVKSAEVKDVLSKPAEPTPPPQPDMYQGTDKSDPNDDIMPSKLGKILALGCVIILVSVIIYIIAAQ